jgi:serine/threonine protein kinase/tetratricopeptide (TPR) repeat protein
MTPDLWERLKPLYHAALEIPEEERANFISNVCGGDPHVSQELAALLKSTDESTAFSDSPTSNLQGLFTTRDDLFSVGALILDRFRIVRHLGTGGMGDVYEATDLELGRIALKTIRADIAGSPDMLSRFKKEVQLARKITGPNVCRIHELFVITGDKNGSHSAFLTMEFLDGITLADRLRRSGPLPWRDAQKISIEICDGLQTIHQAGIIHRDLKSRNIMLASRNGSTCAVLMDFGLAHEISTPTAATATHLTRAGAIIGTPDYMAPEQFEGKKLSPATDVYALGIVLYELLTGKHPFGASTPIGAAIVRGRRPCLASSIQPGLPSRCDEVICKCLEFDAERRYQSAKEVAEDLRSGLFSRAWLRRKRSKVFSAAAILVLFLSSFLLIPATRERLRGMLFSSREKHIVVLPFDLAGDDPETVALGDGLMDSLAGKLSNLGAANQSLWVVPASEVRDRKVKDPSSALRQFGATIVVKGRFERHGHTAHLNLNLIDTRKMREIGFADVEDQTGDLAALQDEAVTRLGRLMNISVRDDLVRGSEGPVTRAAYEDYLTALGYIQRFDKPGNLDLAIAALRNAVKADPHFALGFARLAQVFVLKYRLDSNPKWLQEAQKYCNQALQLDSRVPLAYVALAQVQQHTGHHDLAVQEFQHAIDLDPRDTDALTGIAAVYEDLGRNSDAEAAYIKAAALRPDDWTGYNLLGLFYDKIGRHTESIAQFRRAIELTPDNSALYANLGSAFLNSGDPKLLTEAEQALKKSVAINPGYATYGNLCYLYAVQHRFNESVATCHKALQLNDQSYIVWNNLTIAYEWMKDDENATAARKRAIELLERDVKLNPQDADAQSTLAALAAKDGLRDKAIQCIQSSLALSPNSEYVLSEVADAYELIGDRKRSIKYLEQALLNGMPADQLSGDPEIQSVITDANFRIPGK